MKSEKGDKRDVAKIGIQGIRGEIGENKSIGKQGDNW